MTAYRIGRCATALVALFVFIVTTNDTAEAQRGGRGGGSRGGGGASRSGGSRGGGGFRGSSGSSRVSGNSGRSSSSGYRGSSGGSSAIRSYRGSSSGSGRIGRSSTPNFSGSSGISGRSFSGARNSGGSGGAGQSTRSPRFSQSSSFARGNLFPQTGGLSQNSLRNRGTSPVGNRGLNAGGLRNGNNGLNNNGRSNLVGPNLRGNNRSGANTQNFRNRSAQFSNRWNHQGHNQGRQFGGYRGGLRNSWGLWLAGGYGGWGLGYGNYYGGYGGYYGGYPLGYFGYNYNAPVNGYYNPYCETPGFFPTTSQFDYSQPIIGDTTPNDTAVDGMSLADEAFRAGDYSTALSEVDKAARAMPNNPDLHQFRALVLFAMGKHRDAAAAAHSALIGGHGWNWETIRSFYPAKDAYTAQLRALESARTANPSDVAVRFLLGYHYMMLGHADAAAEQLVVVVEREPRDQLAAELLTAISKQTGKTYRPKPVAPPVPPLPTRDGPQPAPRPLVANKGAVVKLLGTWKSTQPDGTSITLVLQDGNRFRWTADNAGRKTTIEGTFTLQNNQMLFSGARDGQKLEGSLTNQGDDAFQFRLKYLPEDEPGLKFRRG